jgi:hypothetical protein
MERELAEQRRELPHMHPGGESAPPDTFGTLGEPVEAELMRMESGGAPSYETTPAEQAVSESASVVATSSAAEPIGYDRRVESWGQEAAQSSGANRRWLLLLAVAVLGCAGAALAFKAMRNRR